MEKIGSFSLDTDKVLKNMIFSGNGRYLIYQYCGDDAVYRPDTKTLAVDF